jgi:hypothetical protein
MLLPDFNELGDLPLGVHPATIDEVIARFGQAGLQRQLVTKRLLRVFEFAKGTGYLERFVIFGSYVTAKPNPNDVEIVLVMQDDFIGKERPLAIAARSYAGAASIRRERVLDLPERRFAWHRRRVYCWLADQTRRGCTGDY